MRCFYQALQKDVEGAWSVATQFLAFSRWQARWRLFWLASKLSNEHRKCLALSSVVCSYFFRQVTIWMNADITNPFWEVLLRILEMTFVVHGRAVRYPLYFYDFGFNKREVRGGRAVTMISGIMLRSMRTFVIESRLYIGFKNKWVEQDQCALWEDKNAAINAMPDRFYLLVIELPTLAHWKAEQELV